MSTEGKQRTKEKKKKASRIGSQTCWHFEVIWEPVKDSSSQAVPQTTEISLWRLRTAISTLNAPQGIPEAARLGPSWPVERAP